MRLASTILTVWAAGLGVGILSAAFVFSAAWLLRRRTGCRVETTVAVSTVIGWGMLLAGVVSGNRLLPALGLLFGGWMFLALGLVPLLVVVRLSRRARSGRPS